VTRVGRGGGQLQVLVTRSGRLSTRQGVEEGLNSDKISKTRERMTLNLLSAYVKCTP
jgi:hypothetical protein